MQVLKEEGTFEDDHYTPNNPEQTVLAVIDHAGLLIPINGRTKKGEIDECANKLVVVRNKTDLSVLFIMQSNRSVANMERKKNEAFMEPMVEDIKETGTPSEASELILAVYNPQVDKRSSYRGYQVKEMGYRFRSIIVLKSRYGDNLDKSSTTRMNRNEFVEKFTRGLFPKILLIMKNKLKGEMFFL